MKIERDKWYLNRRGDKVRVICVDAGPYMPVIGIGENGDIETFRSDGGFYSAADEREAFSDLVSEYVEPPKPRECWVRKFEDGSLGRVCWESRAQASELPNSKLVLFREVIE